MILDVAFHFALQILKIAENVHIGLPKAVYRSDVLPIPLETVCKKFVLIFNKFGNYVLSEIVAALSDMKVQLLQINTNNVNELEILISLKISCKNVEHYHSIVSRLRSIEGVSDIRRGMAQ